MVMQEFRKSLIDFCTLYRGLKLCVNTRNVGHSLSQMIHTPGGNRVLHSLHIHYANDAFEHEVAGLQTYEHEAVCKEVAAMLSLQSRARYGFDFRHIGLVGKLSTSKYDRDDSQAYISIDEEIFRLKLDALNLEDYIIVHRGKETNIPLLEDYAISQAVLSILSGGVESMPELGKGFLRKVNLLEQEED